jgi:hypothetical protein
MKNNTENRNQRTVPVSSLLLVLVSFVAGLLTALFVTNVLSKQQISLSTYELISFVFTIALGAASVILALISINLSKLAEDALVRRSDEGIKIQNETFVRTSEVLGKIQTSTGVTERRIEDIIAGRTTSIAKEVVERSLPESQTLVSREVVNRLKTEIAESLKTEILPLLSSTPAGAQSYLTELEAKQNRRAEARKRWNEFRQSLIKEVSKLPNSRLLSESEGYYGADEASAFWDCILLIEDTRIALDVHTAEQIADGSLGWNSEGLRKEFLKRICWRILQDKIALTFVVFDIDIWEEPSLKELAKLMDDLNSEQKFNIIRVSGGVEVIAKTIQSRVKEFNSAQ